MKIVFLVLGLFLLAMGLWYIFVTLRCTRGVEGTIQQAVATGSKDVKRYAPVFSYEVDGQPYCGASIQSFPGQYIRRRFVQGQRHTIYVDPKNPVRFVVKRMPQATHWLLAVLGLLVMAMGIRV